jgi:peroxiredoxin
MSKISVNTSAPDFELTGLAGQTVRLSDFRGRNVLLVFNRGFI